MIDKQYSLLVSLVSPNAFDTQKNFELLKYDEMIQFSNLGGRVPLAILWICVGRAVVSFSFRTLPPPPSFPWPRAWDAVES